MSPRRLNMLLWSAAAALGAAAVGALALGVLTPVAVEEAQADPGAGRPGPATTQSARPNLPPLASFESIWNLPLRQPLDATAAVTPQPGPAMVDGGAGGGAVPITLVGTIGDSLALVRTAAGVVEIRGVGEEAAGVKVVAIRPSQVDVEFSGQTITLTKPKDPAEGG